MKHARTGFCERCWAEAQVRQDAGDPRAKVGIYNDVLDEEDTMTTTEADGERVMEVRRFEGELYLTDGGGGVVYRLKEG